MKLIILALALLASTFAFTFQPESTNIVQNDFSVTAIPYPWIDCGDRPWTVDSFTLDQIPKRNINDTITTTGTIKRAVNYKRVDIVVKFNGTPLDKQSTDFVQNYEEGDILEFSFKSFVPSFAPSGAYVMTFTFVDTKEANQGCVGFQFKI